MARFRTWAASSSLGQGPRGFPDLGGRIEPLLSGSAFFRTSWECQSASCRDPRVKAAVALAPAPTVRAFTPDSLAAIGAPVPVMVGEADREAPAESCSAWLHGQLRSSNLFLLGREARHDTLRGLGTEKGLRQGPALWADAPGVDRAAVHDRAARTALAALRSFRQPFDQDNESA